MTTARNRNSESLVDLEVEERRRRKPLVISFRECQDTLRVHFRPVNIGGHYVVLQYGRYNSCIK